MIPKNEATELFKKAGVNVIGTGRDKLIIGVTAKLPLKLLAAKDIVPTKIAGIPTDVIETGRIQALQLRTDRWRPAPGGVSIGHYAITAGTLGGIILNHGGSRVILSNNHVLANSNSAKLGDPILQPGSYDGGTVDDRIAVLDRFIPIKFADDENGNGNGSSCPILNMCVNFLNWAAQKWGSTKRVKGFDTAINYNLVDAALAMPVKDGDISDEILKIGFPKQFGEFELDDYVIKSGRTTERTKGVVSAIQAYVQVGYGGGRTAYFEDQIVVSNVEGPFLQGGDSGSWGVKDDEITFGGLCFAGSETVGIMSRAANVCDAFGGLGLP